MADERLIWEKAERLKEDEKKSITEEKSTKKSARVDLRVRKRIRKKSGGGKENAGSKKGC